MHSPHSRYQELDDWYRNPAGQVLLPQLRSCMTAMQQSVRGDCAVYCGPPGLLGPDEAMPAACQQTVRIYPGSGDGQLWARPEALPLAPDSVDLLVLGHALELSDDPHAVLRQAEWALAPGGCLLLVALNPWSSYGMRRLWPFGIPWSCHFYGFRRIRDWLSVLNFRIEDRRCVGLRPPFQNTWIQQRLGPLEHSWLARQNHFGGVYCVRARKLRVPLTPRRAAWYRTFELPVPLPVAEAQPRNAARYDHD